MGTKQIGSLEDVDQVVTAHKNVIFANTEPTAEQHAMVTLKSKIEEAKWFRWMFSTFEDKAATATFEQRINQLENELIILENVSRK